MVMGRGKRGGFPAGKPGFAPGKTHARGGFQRETFRKGFERLGQWARSSFRALRTWRALREGNASVEGECDVRLQVTPDGWRLWWGLSDYDLDHRGFWGASSVPGSVQRPGELPSEGWDRTPPQALQRSRGSSRANRTSQGMRSDRGGVLRPWDTSYLRTIKPCWPYLAPQAGRSGLKRTSRPTTATPCAILRSLSRGFFGTVGRGFATPTAGEKALGRATWRAAT